MSFPHDDAPSQFRLLGREHRYEIPIRWFNAIESFFGMNALWILPLENFFMKLVNGEVNNVKDLEQHIVNAFHDIRGPKDVILDDFMEQNFDINRSNFPIFSIIEIHSMKFYLPLNKGDC